MGKRILIGVGLCLLQTSFAFAATDLIENISAISVEAETGLVLLEHNPDVQRPPASMIKIMMMLLVTEGLERGDWNLETPIEASRKAQHMGGTQVYLSEGEVHPLGDLMRAIAVASANDAAMAVAEGLWGSEEAYLEIVNARAAELGMSNTEFHSVHGLPPDPGEQPDRTTARDMATLARSCVLHQQILSWTSMSKLRFRPDDAITRTTNALIGRLPECDGLKTGYIRSAGFCITATAIRNGVRIISVVMGHHDKRARFDLAERLLLDGLSEVRKGRLVIPGVTDAPTIRVANSETREAKLAFAEELWVTARRSDWDRLSVVLDYPEEVRAPLDANTAIGEVRVELDGETLSRSPMVLPDPLIEAGWVWKTGHAVKSFFGLADD